MKIETVIREVGTIRDVFGPLLAEPNSAALGAALKNLQEQQATRKTLKKNAKAPPWQLVIPPSSPLTFVSTEHETAVKHHLEIDLACTLSEPDADGIPRGEHNIAVRVWSREESHWFREELDAQSIRDQVHAQQRRVMLKFHFDLANKDQQGPLHHMQVGGKEHHRMAEFCWLPDNWKLPRFVHFPVNLVLACEFLGRTFLPRRFREIADNAEWVHAVREAETAYLFPFFRKLPYLKVDPKLYKNSLLSHVWNG